MFNFIKYRGVKYSIQKKSETDVRYEDVHNFHTMLLKYKCFHPNFDVERVMLRLYPKLKLL